MKIILVLAAALALSAFAQSSYYSRPRSEEQYKTLFSRTPQPSGNAPAPQTPTPPPPTGGPGPGTSSDAPLPLFAPPTAPTEAPASASARPSPIRPGLFFKARLITGVLASPGLTSPVLIEADPGWCGSARCEPLLLLGLATLAANGRAVVVFSQGVLNGQAVPLDATAFDASDRQFGIRGQVIDIAPALAADLIRAGFGGLADWVRALNNQTTVTTLPGGGVATSFQAAPFWSYALGRIGQTIAPPQDATALVRAVVAEADRELLVLTGAAELIKNMEGARP